MSLDRGLRDRIEYLQTRLSNVETKLEEVLETIKNVNTAKFTVISTVLVALVTGGFSYLSSIYSNHLEAISKQQDSETTRQLQEQIKANLKLQMQLEQHSTK